MQTELKVFLQLQHPHLMEFCDIDMEMVEVSLGTPPTKLMWQKVTVWYRLDQALVPRVRIHVARERDAREPAEGDEL